MEKSSKSIIDHIPCFLDYCREVGLSSRTQESYKRFLNKFILWLKKENKTTLLPHKLTPRDIQAYKLYLSQCTDEKGHPLKKITQNYYLIALRALLNYFTTKDIVSLPADKIILLKLTQREKTIKLLNLEQIKRLLIVPDTKTLVGLRDRAILATLITTGFKVRQITNLNKDQLSLIPGEALSYIEEYLQTRKDKNNALFINYKAKKESIGGRLTVRSIEKIVNYYGRKIGLPFSVTPEILRWARAHALSSKTIKIRKPYRHRVSKIKNYILINDSSITPSRISNSWNAVENIVNKEILWLKNNIPVLPENYKENPPFLKYDESIFRKIAILIVSGKVKATEFKSRNENKDLWNNITEKENINKISKHGQEWHKKMMGVISEYFSSQGYKVVLEPNLSYGRADLGIFLNIKNPLYVEVGTVSLFKLWYNFLTMKNATFLIIPSEKKLIEFRT
jgi:integrase/recombinase XerD